MGYPFTFPAHYKIGCFKYEGAYAKLAKFYDPDPDREFTGMNPQLQNDTLVFNSKFECGNLDMVVKSCERDDYYT